MQGKLWFRPKEISMSNYVRAKEVLEIKVSATSNVHGISLVRNPCSLDCNTMLVLKFNKSRVIDNLNGAH